MSTRWRWFLPGYLWSLPHTLVGLLLCLVYRATDWRWSSGCIECLGGDRIFGKPGAQTHGCLIIYRDERARSDGGLRVHERVHVVQGFVGGPFFILAYVGHFAWLYAAQGFGDWRPAYRKIWAEKTAYHIQDEFNAGKRPGAWR